MTAPTKAETYAGWVEGCVYLHTDDRDAIAAELRRLAASEAALLEALELAAEYVDDYCKIRTQALGHLPPCDDRALRIVHDTIAATKEDSRGKN